MKKIKSNSVRIASLNVTHEPLKKAYPKEIEDFRPIFFEKIYTAPDEMIEKLIVLIKKYPNEPMLSNWYLAAHKFAGADRKVLDGIVEQNYKIFPSYLFAKAEYAKMCCRLGKMQMVPEIFNNVYWLGDLYPEREEFHVGEVVAFFYSLGVYYCYKQDIEQAQVCIDLLKQLPLEDNAEAEDLEQLLLLKNPELFAQLCVKFAAKNKKHKKTKI